MKVHICRLCKSALNKPVLVLPDTPLANEFVKTKEKQDLFPLEVCSCSKCGHYQLTESVGPIRLFRNYLFVAGTSPVNVEHFKQYAIHMVEKFALKPGSRILDIASNDGTLLKQFVTLGMSVLGIDPARNLAEEANKNGIPTIPEFFTEDRSDEMLKERGKFDVITANNVFAHVPDLADFAKGVKKLLAHNGVFSFEVSYFVDVCDKTLFDTMYHEHSSYHTLTPLIPFFQSHGLEVFDVERISNHGGSIRVFVRHALSGYHQITNAAVIEMLKQEEGIYKNVEILKKNIKYLGLELRDKLRDYKEQGKSIAIFGAPAKATTLMYVLGIKKEWIDFAVDDAPLKQGTFTPGMHIPVYTSRAIIEHEPDVILILAWNFADSIINNVQKMWEDSHPVCGKYRYPTFIVPLPELKIERYCEGETCTCSDGPWEKDIALSSEQFPAYKCQSCGGIDRGMPMFFPSLKV